MPGQIVGGILSKSSGEGVDARIFGSDLCERLAAVSDVQ